MHPFHITHDLDGSASAFWSLFFDDAYNRAFYASVDITFDVLDDVRDAARITRAVRYVSTRPVPAVMRPFLPNGLGYVEHTVFDRAAQRLEQRVVPDAFESRTDIRGVLTAAPLGGGRIRRTYEGSVSIRMPMVGARLEAATIESMRASQDVAVAVTRAWLAEAAAHGPPS